LLLSILLLTDILLLSGNIFLIKQNSFLHILERVKKTKVKVLGEELGLPDGLVKALFMLLPNLLLVDY